MTINHYKSLYFLLPKSLSSEEFQADRGHGGSVRGPVRGCEGGPGGNCRRWGAGYTSNIQHLFHHISTHVGMSQCHVYHPNFWRFESHPEKWWWMEDGLWHCYSNIRIFLLLHVEDLWIKQRIELYIYIYIYILTICWRSIKINWRI